MAGPSRGTMTMMGCLASACVLALAAAAPPSDGTTPNILFILAVSPQADLAASLGTCALSKHARAHTHARLLAWWQYRTHVALTERCSSSATSRASALTVRVPPLLCAFVLG